VQILFLFLFFRNDSLLFSEWNQYFFLWHRIQGCTAQEYEKISIVQYILIILMISSSEIIHSFAGKWASYQRWQPYPNRCSNYSEAYLINFFRNLHSKHTNFQSCKNTWMFLPFYGKIVPQFLAHVNSWSKKHTVLNTQKECPAAYPAPKTFKRLNLNPN